MDACDADFHLCLPAGRSEPLVSPAKSSLFEFGKFQFGALFVTSSSFLSEKVTWFLRADVFLQAAVPQAHLDMHVKHAAPPSRAWFLCGVIGAERWHQTSVWRKPLLSGRLAQALCVGFFSCCCCCYCCVICFLWVFSSVGGRVFKVVFVLQQSWGDEQQSADRAGGRHPTAALQIGGEGETGGKRDLQRLDFQHTCERLRVIKMLIPRRVQNALSARPRLLLGRYLCVCDAAHRVCVHASSQRVSMKCDKSPSSRLQPACTSDCFGFHVRRSKRRRKKFWQMCSGSTRTKCQTCKRLWTGW